MSENDIIVAPITGSQRAPVAVIRASGEGSWALAAGLFQPFEPRPRYAQFVRLLGGEDEGFLILFEGGHSYTGEESFEVSCHGSPAIVRAVIDALATAGARLARPGEFTERAFLNGRIDLTQAEAVRETIDASTRAQHRRALELRAGRLTQAVRALQEDVGRVLALAEATVDFSEEIGELDRPAASHDLEAAISKIDTLCSGMETSRLLRQGLRIALAGRPNVGKSSLLNALLGMERAIVTQIPGTTRDTIEEAVDVGGYPAVFTDTAGIRDTDDPVEQLGVRRSKEAVKAADEIWLVFESPQGWTQADEALRAALGRQPHLLVANKCDLGGAPDVGVDAAAVSALTGEGIDRLRERVVRAFDVSEEGLPLVNDRSAGDLRDAKTLLQHAVETLSAEDRPTDLACVDLYGALKTLGRITGETAPDEVIARVFAEFCIGK